MSLPDARANSCSRASVFSGIEIVRVIPPLYQTQLKSPRLATMVIPHDPRKPLPIDRRPFGPDDCHPGLSLTCLLKTPEKKNSKTRWVRPDSGITRRPRSPLLLR